MRGERELGHWAEHLAQSLQKMFGVERLEEVGFEWKGSGIWPDREEPIPEHKTA